MSDELLTPVPVTQVGRARARHRSLVLIKEGRVVVRTACGMDAREGFIHTTGFITCDDCLGET